MRRWDDVNGGVRRRAAETRGQPLDRIFDHLPVTQRLVNGDPSRVAGLPQDLDQRCDRNTRCIVEGHVGEECWAGMAAIEGMRPIGIEADVLGVEIDDMGGKTTQRARPAIVTAGEQVRRLERNAEVLAIHAAHHVEAFLHRLAKRPPMGLLGERDAPLRGFVRRTLRMGNIGLALQHDANERGTEPFCEVEMRRDV